LGTKPTGSIRGIRQKRERAY